MRKINIIHVGELKETYFKQAVDEYEKRLSPFYEIKSVAIKEDSSNKPEETIKRESADISTLLDTKSYQKTYTFILSPEGKKLTSESFAGLLQSQQTINAKAVNFIIGGSHGLSPALKSKSNCLLSFSDFTFPHQLMRIILLEQIYRSATISANIRYHK